MAMQLPNRGGLVGAAMLVCCLLVAAPRLRRAIWLNHRYRFAVWRWGRVALLLVVLGLLLRHLLAVATKSPVQLMDGAALRSFESSRW